MTSPAATPPAGTAELRDLLTPIASWLAARDGYSFATELGDREREHYLDAAGRLAEAAALPIAALRERAEKAERESERLKLERRLCDARIRCQRASLRQANSPNAMLFLTDAQHRLIKRMQQRGKELRAAESRLATLAAENEALRAALTDPVAVHVNMLAGKIAKPSIANIVHLYGADALRTALAQGGFDAA